MQLYKSGHYIEALKEFTIIAENNKNDMTLLAEIMKCITNILKDTTFKITPEFTKWIEHEANINHNSFAQNNLAYMYDSGLGVTKNSKKAEELYKLSADQGNVVASTNLGLFYQVTDHHDSVKIEALHKIGAEKGFSYSQNNLGNFYAKLFSWALNKEAVKWLKLSVDQNNAVAQLNLGAMYTVGAGVEVNWAEALRLYKLSANQGNENARDEFNALFKKVCSNPTASNDLILNSMLQTYFDHDELEEVLKEQEVELSQIWLGKLSLHCSKSSS